MPRKLKANTGIYSRGYTRMLKVPLHPADVLYFRQMQGVDIAPLLGVIEPHFADAQIFPLTHAEGAQSFEAFTPQQRSEVRLVRGQLEFGTGDQAVYRYISRNPIRIVMLREPISRVWALYTESGQSAPISEFLHAHPELRNEQVRSVIGLSRRANPADFRYGYSAEALMKLAEDDLRQHLWVGLFDEYAKSLRLLTYTFDWPPARVERLPKAAPLPEMEAETRRQIEEWLDLDIAFYAFAHALFAERDAQLADELLDFEHTIRWKPSGAGDSGAKSSLYWLQKKLTRRVKRMIGKKSKS